MKKNDYTLSISIMAIVLLFICIMIMLAFSYFLKTNFDDEEKVTTVVETEETEQASVEVTEETEVETTVTEVTESVEETETLDPITEYFKDWDTEVTSEDISREQIQSAESNYKYVEGSHPYNWYDFPEEIGDEYFNEPDCLDIILTLLTAYCEDKQLDTHSVEMLGTDTWLTASTFYNDFKVGEDTIRVIYMVTAEGEKYGYIEEE